MSVRTAASTGHTFRLPDLGEGLTEAEILTWLVAEGDEVAVDQVVVEVETAKSVVELPSPYAGIVRTVHAPAGTTLAVGEPLITVAASRAEPEPALEPALEPAVEPAVEPRVEPGAAERYREEEQAGSGNVLIGYGTSHRGGPGRRRRPRVLVHTPAPAPAADGPVRVISPLVRKLARDHGVDVSRIEPTGYHGIVTKADVERAIDAGSAGVADTGERRIPLNGFRKAVAEAVARSRREIPEATVWVDVDATPLWELRESARTTDPGGPGLMAYLARFVVAGLKAYPMLNARLDTERDEIVEYDRIDLGIAVQGERGLVVPAVMDAGSMTAYELDAAIRDLTARARVGKVSAAELAAGTFTLNNYGSFRVDGSAAIVNHPQVAILGFGRIIDKPWVVDGRLAVRKLTTMSFVFDHRVCDGGTAAGFMRLVADAIENPAAAIARL